MWKNRLFSIINLVGLIIGFTTVILISVWIKNELSFDRYHKNYKNIYRLTVEVNNPNGYRSHFARNWQTWTRQMPNYFSEIEFMALFAPLRSTDIKMEDIKFNSNQVFQCNSEVLDIFDIPIVSGSAREALSEPNRVLISETLYNTYFEGLPLSETTLEMSGAFDTEFSDYQLAGVFRDFPPNAHFHPEILISLEDPENFNGWAYTYIKLPEGVTPSQLLNNFSEFADNHIDEDQRNNSEIHLQSISDIHLYSHKDREIEKNGDVKVVWIFSAIGLVVLLIVLINYINLNTVLLLKRNPVFVLKKILGSDFLDIARTLLFETIFLNFIAASISFILILLGIPFLQNIFPINLISDGINFLIVSYLVLVSVSIIISVIPQFFLILKLWYRNISFLGSEPDQSTLLKNKNLGFRKVFIITQFIASIVLISSAYYIDSQEKYLWKRRMGFKEEAIVVLKELNWKKRGKYAEFKNRLLESNLIKDITASMEPPSGFIMDAMGVNMEGLSEVDDLSIFVFPVEENFIDFYNIPLITGEKFSTYSSDFIKEEYILNETALEHLGFEFPEQAIGRQFKLDFSIDSLFKGGIIKGVVKDFNLSPLLEKVKPLVLFQKPIWYSTILIKIDNSNKKESIQFIRNIWDEIYPEYLFDYSYDDDLYLAAYQNEILQSRISKFLTLLAIIISSMGLFGISTYIVQIRTKEIGIRKINGASSANIFYMLTKEFLQWIIIALVIAAPISWYIIRTWGENYPYKVEFSWWTILFAGAIALLLALSAISYYTIKASRQNPVEVLHYE